MIGAAGGAVYAKRPNAYQKRRWDVLVKMDGGGERVLQQRYEPFFRAGDRVRVDGNATGARLSRPAMFEPDGFARPATTKENQP